MSDLAYQPFYCEENVWHLLQHARLARCERWAVWVMAKAGHCPVWRQRAADSDQEPIFWDYHVWALARETASAAWQVWDLDTTLGCPVPLADYLRLAFPYAGRLPRGFEPWFRVVPAEDYVRLFASDRAHMKDRRGHWRHPPPPWPAIRPDQPSTLARFRDLADPIAGRVLSCVELARQPDA